MIAKEILMVKVTTEIINKMTRIRVLPNTEQDSQTKPFPLSARYHFNERVDSVGTTNF